MGVCVCVARVCVNKYCLAKPTTTTTPYYFCLLCYVHVSVWSLCIERSVQSNKHEYMNNDGVLVFVTVF